MSKTDPLRPADVALTERASRVVSAIKLHRAAARRKVGLFLAEGANAVSAALDASVVEEVFVTEVGRARNLDLVSVASTQGLRVSFVTERAARELSKTVTPPGIIAVCRMVDADLDVLVDAKPSLLAVPVEISDPGNAGTVIRVADAVGAGGVILAGDSVDPHNGKAVRASAGSIFHLPIVRERQTDQVINALRTAGILVLATAADGELELDRADEVLRQPTAWLFGNEAHGLDSALASAADHRVRIPIRGRAESLNLATAAAICLYASARVQALG
ncbi:MAG: TrmH family RNA methyltransferase [Mycobacteriaceae bacterium]